MLTRGFIISLLLAGLAPAAAPTTRYVCRRAQGEIQVDGKLDEAAWEKAEWTNDFGDITGDVRAEKPKHRTRAKMVWTATHLYIAAELEEPNVHAEMKEHDAPLFKENAFEIFLDPDADRKNYAELQVNALGTVMELVMDKTYIERGKPDMSFDAPEMKTAVHVDGTLNDASDVDRGWSIEVAIPFESLKALDLKARPRAGEYWRVNLSRVYRETKESKASYWTWTPQGTVNMHVPDKWGLLMFEQ